MRSRPPRCPPAEAGRRAEASQSFLRLRRLRTAAAAAPNKIIIGGAGTGVPPELDELPEEELLLLLELDELLDEEELVELVMLPELEPLVEIPPLLLLDDEDPDELEPDEPEPLLPP